MCAIYRRWLPETCYTYHYQIAIFKTATFLAFQQAQYDVCKLFCRIFIADCIDAVVKILKSAKFPYYGTVHFYLIKDIKVKKSWIKFRNEPQGGLLDINNRVILDHKYHSGVCVILCQICFHELYFLKVCIFSP